MAIGPNSRSTARAALLDLLLMHAAWAIPSSTAFDPRQTPGLSDVKTYASLATGAAILDPEDMRFRRFRVLVPWIAQPFYRIARGRVGTWDPAMFGLLVSTRCSSPNRRSDCHARAVLWSARRPVSRWLGGRVAVSGQLRRPECPLVGLVDAGEGLFLLALLWSLSESSCGCCP